MKIQWCITLLLAVRVSSIAQIVSKTILEEPGIENAYPRLSRDGKKILYQSDRYGNWQLCICDIDGKRSRRLTNDTFNDNLPDWSEDNEWIAFVSDRDGNEEVYLMKEDGSGLQRITEHPGRDIHPYFSPDGRYLLFNSDRNNQQFDVYRYELASGKTERLTATPQDETCARYAPDMQHIVLLRNSEAADDIYLLRADNFTSINISNTPHVYHGWPVFSNDGAWVYYSSMESGTYSIFRVRVNGKDKQQLTRAKAGEEHARVNVSADGRFMICNIREGKTIKIVSMPVR